MYIRTRFVATPTKQRATCLGLAGSELHRVASSKQAQARVPPYLSTVGLGRSLQHRSVEEALVINHITEQASVLYSSEWITLGVLRRRKVE